MARGSGRPARTAVMLTTLLLALLAACAGAASGPATTSGPASTSGPATVTTTVRVAAASDLRFALEDIGAALAESRPDIVLATTYGSSGTFHQQLMNGAPFDLFLSADLSYPRELVAAGLAREEDLFAYAVGRLVVWAPNDSPVDPTAGLAALLDPAARTVAIANPEHAPYGKAAVAAMTAAGIYDQVSPRLVLGENVAQAAEFVQSGNAQVGVIALSLAVSPELRDAGRWAEVPLEDFPRLDQGGVVLGSAQDPAAARAVRDFLTGEQGRAILRSNGFFLPGE